MHQSTLIVSLVIFITAVWIVLMFQIIDVPVYPDLSEGHYSTDFGIRFSDCGDITKHGLTFYKDGAYYSLDSLETVKSWYKQFGWSNFVMKGGDLGIVHVDEFNIGKLEISLWKRAQHMERFDSVHIMTDSYLSFCLPKSD